jgi:methionyl-tRNA formyltransferase
MGTPDFAVATLKSIVESGYDVVGVITAPDKPTGRGQIMSESAVKKYAVSQNLTILQPEKLKNPDFLNQLKSLNADLQVVVAFRMLPEVVWSMPPKGTINLHGSLLPQYRGAAPINWAIINGETYTGVTTFFIEKEIDTGHIIFSDLIEIGPDQTAGEVHDLMMEVGANLVIKTLKAIESGSYPSQPQDFSHELKHAPKIFKETCEIDWGSSAKTIHNFVRGLSPFPGAWTTFQNKNLKIFKVDFFEGNIDQMVTISNEIFELRTDQKKFLIAKTDDGWLNLSIIQLEGKKRMNTEDFLRGYRF